MTDCLVAAAFWPNLVLVDGIKLDSSSCLLSTLTQLYFQLMQMPDHAWVPSPRPFKFWCNHQLHEAACFDNELYYLKHRFTTLEAYKALGQTLKHREREICITIADNHYCLWINIKYLRPDDLG